MNANAPHDAIDNTIDRALSALRDAQPRSGLEGRILTSLEHRTTVLGGPSFRIAKGWGIARPGSPANLFAGVGRSARENLGWTAHLALWTATAAAIIAVASMLILHHHRNHAIEFAQAPRSISTLPKNAVILSERSESKNPDALSRATNPEPFFTTNLAQPTHTLSSRPERVARSGETPVFRNCPDHQNQGCPIHDDNVGMGGLTTTPSDAQLLADLHAPSHPAPPFTLSPQEKLVLHMLRYGNATQLAELNPIVRARHDDEETTAFKAFFPDPPPLQQPNGDTE